MNILLRRLLEGLIVLLLVHAATFAALRLMPGDPWADAAGDRALPPAAVARLKQLYGADQPILTQYVHDLAAKCQGDFGISIKLSRGTPVSTLIADALPVSMALGCGALAVSLGVGLWAGVISARRARRWPDHFIRTGATLGISTPDFVIAPLALAVFSLWLGWLPAGGTSGTATLILPVLVLGLPLAAAIARLTRTSMMEELRADFVRTARAKGAADGSVVYDHALRPALGPVLAYVGQAAAAALTGAMVVEQLFAIPGLGAYFVTGALSQDWPLVSAAALVYAVVLVIFNLLADLALAALDPRTR
jgi:oligopeptide transport system permease protein